MHLLTLKEIRIRENKGELYASMYDVLNDLQRNDADLVECLDNKLLAGELTSLEDIADWFLSRFYEKQRECETLLKRL